MLGGGALCFSPKPTADCSVTESPTNLAEFCQILWLPLHPLRSFESGQLTFALCLAMRDKSSSNEVGGRLSVGLRRCMCIISKSTEGTCLDNLDKDRGHGGKLN